MNVKKTPVKKNPIKTRKYFIELCAGAECKRHDFPVSTLKDAEEIAKNFLRHGEYTKVRVVSESGRAHREYDGVKENPNRDEFMYLVQENVKKRWVTRCKCSDLIVAKKISNCLAGENPIRLIIE